MDQSSLEPKTDAVPTATPVGAAAVPPSATSARPAEHGGRRASVSKGLEPTRFGDWEKDGRCIDF